MKMNNFLFKLILIISIFLSFGHVSAQEIKNYEAVDLLPRSDIFIAPRTGSFIVGSTFESQIYIDTKGNNVNAINLEINYDKDKLSLVNPSGGRSIFGIWVEPPYYDNSKGIAGMAGVITEGVTASSGLIVTMTFKVIAPGTATISVSNETTVNLNDGFGSEVLLNKGRAVYTLNNRPPEGVSIFSETHPISDKWYNNNSPIFNWADKQKSEGYSVVFDTIFQTMPDSIINTKEAFYSKNNVPDGIWYLHVRPVYKNVWGNKSSYSVRIDTQPPAEFKPKVSKIKDDKGNKNFLVSFFTTDSLSGLGYYEVGVIDKKKSSQGSPVFIETTPPYIVSPEAGKNSRVIIRAYDVAGNLREEFVDIYPGIILIQNGQKALVYILVLFVLFLLAELILHYMYGHHVLDKIKMSYKIFKKVSGKYNKEEGFDSIKNTDELAGDDSSKI